MRRYVILVFLFLQAMICNGQSAVGTSTMSFAESVYDFGTIKEQDGSVSHTFVFTNTGSRPFVIENVAVTCGCTTPTYSKAPVMPGKTGTVEITFDPMGRPGEFLKEIVVTSDNRANRNVIKIKGTVEPRPRTVEDDYPVELSSGVRISDMNLNFRYVAQGKNSSMRVGVINTSNKSVTLGTSVEPSSPFLKIATPVTTLCAGCRTEFTVTYDFGKGADWGVMSNSIYMLINGVRQNIPISATAIFVDDFSNASQQQMEGAPRVKLSMQYYNFGDVKPGADITCEITLTNQGDLPLIIRRVQPTDGVTVSLKSGTSIAPQQSVKIKCTISASQLRGGRLSKSITLITNDPIRAMREIRLAAFVQ